MKLLNFFLIGFFTLSLIGCGDKKAELTCSTPAVHEQLKDQFVKQAMSGLTTEDFQELQADENEVRSYLNQLQYTVSEITTTSKDKNYVQCAARFSISYPEHLGPLAVKKISRLANASQSLTLTALARDRGVDVDEQKANTFFTNITFDARYTDDKKSILVNSNLSEKGLLSKYTGLTALALSTPDSYFTQRDAENALASEVQILREKQEQKELEEQQKAQEKGNTDADLPEDIDNKLNQAIEENSAAKDKMNNIWSNLNSIVKDELQTSQRNWNASKQNTCEKEAYTVNDARYQEYKRLQCDTKMTRSRVQYLKGYADPGA